MNHCRACNAPHRGKVQFTFLGFRKFKCAKCGSDVTLPLSGSVKVAYYIILGIAGAASVFVLATGGIPIPGVVAIGAFAGLMQDRKVRRG